MNTINRKRTQLSVMAVAALAVFAVAAVMLPAGGNPAQATTASLAPDYGGNLPPEQGGGNPTPTPTRTIATPEPCPGEPASPYLKPAPAVDSGHIALFDVWWNPRELELTNSSCPPYVEHRNGEDIRYPSDINIDETVIHIPSAAKVTLNETDYPKEKYQQLWDADDKENPGGVGDRIVWRLPACPPEGTPGTNDLCLMFSAALLNDTDWTGNIVYHVDHVHQVDIDKQDPRYVLVYEGIRGRNQLRWDSSDARRSEMPVPPGGYDRPMWFFTSRGMYEFQVHITGEPEQDTTVLGGLKPISMDPSVNSDVRTYILHVGAEADLSVGYPDENGNQTFSITNADPVDTTIDPGDDVTITLTASNAGPDEAEKTKVDVGLPAGLTYSSHTAPTDDTFTYSEDVGTWTWGAGKLCPPGADPAECDQPASATLTITATVDAGTRGETLKVKATISATETITTANGTYDVPVIDPDPDNNMGMATVTVATNANVDPMFMVMRSVRENSAVGTTVGDPIKVMEPNTGDTLIYTLTGAGSGRFGVNPVAGGAQIVVKQHSAGINYEDAQSYKLVMGVSDGLDKDGNPNRNAPDAVDHTIGVMVNVENVENESLAITLQADRTRQVIDGHVLLTPTVTSSPVATSQLEIIWQEVNSDETDSNRQVGVALAPRWFTYGHPATRHYTVEAVYTDENNHEVTASDRVTVSWHYPN